MKESILMRPLFFFLVVLSTSVVAGALISEFRAEPGFNQVELKWIVTVETDVKGYRVMRSHDRVSFEEIAFVDAKGAHHGERTYTYIDDKVFKPSGNTYYYKLVILQTDEQAIEYDKVCSVSPQISSARHTWGSIKAMFR